MHGSRGVAWLGKMRLGVARRGSQGLARHFGVWLVGVRRGLAVAVWPGSARSGGAWLGKVWLGVARRGSQSMAVQGMARQDSAWLGRAFTAD